MKIGFLLPYRDDDDTALCLAAAEVLDHYGAEVSIGTTLSRRVKVHPDWDDRCETVKPSPSSTWVKNQNIIVCTNTHNDLMSTSKHKNRRWLVRILQCDALGEFTKKKTKPKADWYVSPSKFFAKSMVNSLGMKNVINIPWDLGLPVTKKFDTIANPIRALIPLYGDNARRSSTDIIPIVSKLSEENEKNLRITIAYSRTSAPFARRMVEEIAKTSKGQVETAVGLCWSERVMLYGKHDLTILPYVVDGAGIAAITSTSMGTPCFALDIAPINEYIQNGVSGILVPTTTKKDKTGVPIAEPDYELFYSQLSDTINSVHQLNILNTNAHTGIAERAEKFKEKWRSILEI